jgi:hypothetical protein
LACQVRLGFHIEAQSEQSLRRFARPLMFAQPHGQIERQCLAVLHRALIFWRYRIDER